MKYEEGACCPCCGIRLLFKDGGIYCQVCGWGRNIHEFVNINWALKDKVVKKVKLSIGEHSNMKNIIIETLKNCADDVCSFNDFMNEAIKRLGDYRLYEVLNALMKLGMIDFYTFYITKKLGVDEVSYRTDNILEIVGDKNGFE